MICNLRSLTVGMLAVAAIVAAHPAAHAQGTTASAITGTITGEGGKGIGGAEVQLVNPDTGDLFTATTNGAGKFTIDNVPPGGPYIMTASANGYQVGGLGNIELALGQRLALSLSLQAGGVEEIVIQERIDQLQDRSRTGPTTTVREEKIKGLPLLGRNFTDLVSTSPQASGNSIAGQNNRQNNIQIDGGANNDLFGLAGNGTPGGQANAKPISVEAIQEFVVQVAPFDVRQSSFTGGLVNAITKSGTNEFHGTLFGYFQNKSLAGFHDDDSVIKNGGTAFADFSTWQFGANVGGPIWKDKVHFFISGDFQQREAAFGSTFQITGTDASSAADIMKAGFDKAFVDSLKAALAKYGVNDPGDALAPDLANPDRNVFVKLSTSLIKNSRLELSYNFVDASQDILSRNNATSPALPAANAAGVVTSAGALRDGYQLTNAGYAQANDTHTLRLKLLSNFMGGKLSNEFLGGFSIIRDSRDMPEKLPLILVKAPMRPAGAVADSWVAIGGERFSHENILDQNIYTLQDNVTWGGLTDHRLTLGTYNEFLHVRNVFFQAAFGAWMFDSLAGLEAGTPVAYQRRFSASTEQDGGTADFNVAQLGVYLQDEWNLLPNFVITPGVRLDVPFLSDAITNQRILASTMLPIDTGKIPSGNPLWSPRIGFNWDVQSNQDTIVRGGAGIFTGRPAYVWLSNAYSINGLSQVELTCVGTTGLPAFTADPNAQPVDCKGGTTPPGIDQVPATEIDYFDPDTKYPQNLRMALGADRRLPYEIILSGDFLYTQDVNGWYTTDSNLQHVGVSAEGRALYGTFAATGFRAQPARLDTTNITQAVEVLNKNGPRVYNLTLQASKRFAKWLDVNASYTYTSAKDLISLQSSQAASNLRFTPLDGTLDDRNLRPSGFERPHRVTLTGVASLPYGFGVGLTYVGQSGLPYSWVYNNTDVNADGMTSNDLVYVPNDPTQITLQDPTQWDMLKAGSTADQDHPELGLDDFIKSQGCLNSARGHIIKRGACRNPWSNIVNMRLSYMTPPVLGQRIEVQLDIFNFMNLLNSDWGRIESAASASEFNQLGFLRPVGYDQEKNRPIYQFAPPLVSHKDANGMTIIDKFQDINQTQFSSSGSYWRIQLGARYMF